MSILSIPNTRTFKFICIGCSAYSIIWISSSWKTEIRLSTFKDLHSTAMNTSWKSTIDSSSTSWYFKKWQEKIKASHETRSRSSFRYISRLDLRRPSYSKRTKLHRIITSKSMMEWSFMRRILRTDLQKRWSCTIKEKLANGVHWVLQNMLNKHLRAFTRKKILHRSIIQRFNKLLLIGLNKSLSNSKVNLFQTTKQLDCTRCSKRKKNLRWRVSTLCSRESQRHSIILQRRSISILSIMERISMSNQKRADEKISCKRILPWNMCKKYSHWRRSAIISCKISSAPI